MEIFKDLLGYEYNYQVSNYGTVKSKSRFIKNHSKLQFLESKTKSQKDNGKGYKTVDLWKDGKQKTIYVHRIVYESFNGKIPNGYDINHKDGKKDNNKLENLEIMTRSENIKHSFDVLKRETLRGFKHSRNKTGYSNISIKNNNFCVCLRIKEKRYERQFNNIYDAICYHNAVNRHNGINIFHSL